MVRREVQPSVQQAWRPSEVVARGVAARALRYVVGPIQRGWQARRLSVGGCCECPVARRRGVAVALHCVRHVALVWVMKGIGMCRRVHGAEPRGVL